MRYIAILLLMAPMLANAQSPLPPKVYERFLANLLDEHSAETQYAFAITELDHNPDTEEAIAYFQGTDWCGTGGCTVLVLQRRQNAVRLVSQIATAWLPIRVFDGSTKGWRDIGAHVAGGGVWAHEAILPFDGVRYPVGAASDHQSNRRPHTVRSRIVIPEDAMLRPLSKPAP